MQLWQSTLSSQRMVVLPKIASLVKDHAVVKDASLFKGEPSISRRELNTLVPGGEVRCLVKGY